MAIAKEKLSAVSSNLDEGKIGDILFHLSSSHSNIKLRQSPNFFRFNVTPLYTYRVHYTANATTPIETGREALASFRFYDGQGFLLPAPYDGLAISTSVGAYRYLNREGSIAFTPPSGAAMAEIGFQLWHGTSLSLSSTVRIQPSFSGGFDKRLREAQHCIDVALSAVQAPNDGPAVLSVMDEISNLNWGTELNLTHLSRWSFRDQMRSSDACMLLLESAWRANEGEWEHAFTSPGLTHQNAVALQEAIDLAKGRHLPVVFWNKEDPLHYDKFLPFAARSDHVFTTDSACIERYQRDLSGKKAHSLPFAANFAISNPIGRSRLKQGSVCFAGGYYGEGHEDRKRQMSFMLEPIRAFKGTIYDRHSYLNSTRYKFPEPYAEFVRPSVPFSEMTETYRRFKVFLNVNTITDSDTMMSRRVYELLASGTPVVSAPSKAIEAQFQGIVQVASTAEEATHEVGKLLDDDLHWRKTSHLGVRRIADLHQYKHRRQLLAEIVLDTSASSNASPRVSVIMATRRPGYVQRILENLARQDGISFEIVFAVSGAWTPSEIDQLQNLRDRNRWITNISVIHTGDAPLGAKLNAAASKSTGDVICKMDDDDFYFPNYLKDLVLSYEIGDFDIVGKQSHALYLEAENRIVWMNPGNARTMTNFVVGATLSFRRELLDSVRFPEIARGEDTEFLRRASVIGATIYSADEFNFIVFRSADHEHHTWRADSRAFLEKGLNCGGWEQIDRWIV